MTEDEAVTDGKARPKVWLLQEPRKDGPIHLCRVTEATKVSTGMYEGVTLCRHAFPMLTLPWDLFAAGPECAECAKAYREMLTPNAVVESKPSGEDTGESTTRTI